MKYLAMIAIAILMLAACAGCTQGQMTPGPIKNTVYAASADAQVTAAVVRAMPTTQPADVAEQRDRALAALDRIGGTMAKGYTDGLLSPIIDWFHGTKPGGDK